MAESVRATDTADDDVVASSVRNSYRSRVRDLATNASKVDGLRMDPDGGHGWGLGETTQGLHLLGPKVESVPIGSNLVSFWRQGDQESAREVTGDIKECLGFHVRGAHMMRRDGRGLPYNFETEMVQRTGKAIERFEQDASTQAKKDSIKFLRKSVEKTKGFWGKLGEWAAKAVSIVITVGGAIGAALAPGLPGKFVGGSFLAVGLASIWRSWTYYKYRQWWREAGELTADMLEAQLDHEQEQRARED
jgi:hypothetical protein